MFFRYGEVVIQVGLEGSCLAPKLSLGAVLCVVGSEKIMKMIGDDERFEVAARPQYLLDAINALKSEDYIQHGRRKDGAGRYGNENRCPLEQADIPHGCGIHQPLYTLPFPDGIPGGYIR